jgi:hypothetical protein
MLFQVTRDSIYRDMLHRPVSRWTWRDRLRYRIGDWKGRIRLAIEVLRGQHDCGDW